MTTSTQTQLRRGTTAQVNAMTPVAGEAVVDTTLSRICVGDGATAGGIKHATAKDVQNQVYTAGTVGGTGDAITLTNSPVVGAYASGQKFTFKAGAANTTATTLNVDGLGVKNVKKMNNGALAALVANDIISGGTYDVIYDGTQFQIKGLAEGPYSSGSLVYLGTVTATGVATATITSKISSTYDDYMIIMSGITSVTNNVNLMMRVSTDNGATYDSTSNYTWRQVKNGTGTTGTSTEVQIANAVSNTSNSVTQGEMKLYNVNSSTQSKMATAAIVNAGGDFFTSGWVWGQNTAITAFEFYMSAGNIATGTFKIYGIAKA